MINIFQALMFLLLFLIIWHIFLIYQFFKQSETKNKLKYGLGIVIYLLYIILLSYIIFNLHEIKFWFTINKIDSIFLSFIILGLVLTLPPIFKLTLWFWEKWKFKKNQTLPTSLDRRQFLTKATLASLVLGTPLSYSIISERENVEIIHLTLAFKNLPKSFHGIKLVQLSDIHTGDFMSKEYLDDIVHLVNEIKGDILLLTGDFVSHNLSRFTDMTQSFSHFNPSYQKLACLGNHDFWTNPNLIAKGLNSIGIQVLRNENQSVKRDNDSIFFIGIDDIQSDYSDIKKAMANIPQDQFTLLLCHNPDFIYTASQYQINLMVSGHTHGGQVQLPFIGALIVPCNNKQLYQGLHQDKDSYLYVNRGIGVSGLPIRFFCRPEITVFTLEKEV